MLFNVVRQKSALLYFCKKNLEKFGQNEANSFWENNHVQTLKLGCGFVHGRVDGNTRLSIINPRVLSALPGRPKDDCSPHHLFWEGKENGVDKEV